MAKKPVTKITRGKKTKSVTPDNLTAEAFINKLREHQSKAELEKIKRYFKSETGEYGEGDQFMGVRMGQVFALAKAFIDMTPKEIERLLESPLHEARAGAVSVMDFQARSRKIPDERKKVLFDLYLRRHDRINNWDLVDRSAQWVIGGYLADKPRKVLYKLAKSKKVWERRTAIVSTSYFIRMGDVEDTFLIAEMLLKDPHDLVQKAVGGWVRHAGTKDRPRLLEFLDKYAAIMPRTMLRYAIEHLNPKQREYYMGLK